MSDITSAEMQPLTQVMTEEEQAVYTWDITDLQVFPSYNELTNVVVKVFWKFTCTYKGASGMTHGEVSLQPPVPDNFTSFDSLTKETVLGWVQSNLASQIDFFKQFTLNLCKVEVEPKPVSVSLPWVPAPTDPVVSDPVAPTDPVM